MISVVVPVYNVRDYLDRCVESIVKQTFKETEILLINDGSTDGSEEKCHEWERRDSRIRVFSKNNEGLGPTRAYGIRASKYDILAFIDPDDWWEPDTLLKLYVKMKETGADIVRFNLRANYFDADNYFIGDQELRATDMIDRAEKTADNPNLICMTEPSFVLRLYKKKLFTDNHIEIPNIFGEDRAVSYFILSKSSRIARVHEALYNYHTGRAGSNCTVGRDYDSVLQCIEYICHLFEKEGTLTQYYFPVQQVAYAAAREGLVFYERANGRRGLEEFKASLEESLLKRFGEKCNKIYVWGSYSARRMAFLAFPHLYERREHQGYSCIISAMSSELDASGIGYPDNAAREKWIIDDFRKNFWKVFQPERRDVLIIDLLEERFDPAECETSFFTYSDICREALGGWSRPYRILDSKERDFWRLWEEKCLEFIGRLRERIPADRVILVKNKLTEEYGDEKKRVKFLNWEYIRQVNGRLDRCYQFFENHFPGVKVVEPAFDDTFFTDKYFCFGCYPWHVNECYYMNTASRINQMI